MMISNSMVQRVGNLGPKTNEIGEELKNAGASQQLVDAVQRADLDGDGAIQGKHEMRALQNALGRFGGGAGDLEALLAQVESSMQKRAAMQAKPSRGLGGGSGSQGSGGETGGTQGGGRTGGTQGSGQGDNTQGTSGADTTAESTGGGAPDGEAKIHSTQNEGGTKQMVSGQITVNGNTYDFRSGGHASGSLPKGDYTVDGHRKRGENSMSVGGVGYSFNLSDKYDARVGRNRSALRIHPDGGSAGTAGCIGIVGNADVQRRFEADMKAAMAKNGGKYTLRVS